MEDTTIRVSKATAFMLKEIADIRKRKESKEQVILELIHRYLKEENAKNDK